MLSTPSQSHYGAIATSSISSSNALYFSFNPTMVRLRLFMVCDNVARMGEFQSHYGAIATRPLSLPNSIFQTVSIPLWCDCDLSWAWGLSWTRAVSIPLWCDCDPNKGYLSQSHSTCFNPTMVRLRRGYHISSSACTSPVSIPLWCDCDAAIIYRPQLVPPLFQSHYGAIATDVRTVWYCGKRASFNPTMVRLRLVFLVTKTIVSSVSIPLWCDCDHSYVVTDDRGIGSFNPTMVRLRPAVFPFAITEVKSFNPTMVRLRRSPNLCQAGHRGLFQSHYGAIATMWEKRCQSEDPSFNPTMVRLRLGD